MNTATFSGPDRRELHRQLDEPFALEPGQIEQFRRDGYVKLKHVLSPEVLDYYGQEITRQVIRLNDQNKPMSERTTYEKAFLQIMNLWTKSEIVKEFAFSRRLARIAAELMGVKGVRMYHDQALYKEPGGGITPWHADQYYWPVSSSNTVTVWIPLQATPLELGPLAFSVGSQFFEMGRQLEISDESEAKLQRSLKDNHYPLDETPFDLGEVSYHYGWTFHRAAPNTSDRARAVMTVIYIEDGIRLIEPKTKHHRADHATWMPGAQVGEVVATPLNPILYKAD
jgi:ectoine hydroxylase-related dioxygenase (phytanoyl-CoA dioxygenase family)